MEILAYAFIMPSATTSYDALPSDASSTNATLHQPESQLSCEAVESYTESLASHLPSRTCNLHYWKSWESEFAACLLVLATPVILFATLYPHHGQPLPQWPFKLSINSLISVYTLVLKAAIGVILTSCIGQLQWMWFSETRPLTDMLLFDNATRGADGALGLIWRQRFREPLTALGCVIMVLAVAVDPFVQQLVRPVDCSVEVSDGSTAATLPRTNVFEGKGYNGNANSTDSIQNKSSLEMTAKDIQRALYSAVSSPGHDPPRQCSTGNCTFPDTYGTIGICHSCQDSSVDVTIKRTCSEADSSYASQHPKYRTDCPDNSEFTVESSFGGPWYGSFSTNMTVSANGFPSPPVDVAIASNDLPNFPEGSVRRLLFGVLIGAIASSDGRIDWTTSDNSTCNSDESKDSWNCQSYGAATCSLHPCVNLYNATISAGVLEEHLVESSSSTPWGMISDQFENIFYLALIDTQCSANVQTPSSHRSSTGSRWLPMNLTLTDQKTTSHKTPTPFEFGIPELSLPSNITSLLDSGCLYLVSVHELIVNLSQYLHGVVQAHRSSIEGGPLELADFEGPQLVQSMYNWGHTDLDRVQSVFANISDGLTTYIRAHGGTQQRWDTTNLSKGVQGKVYHYATCLQVQWPWLSFPASLAVLTALFFSTVVEATRRQGTTVWKAAPLAWILRADGLGNEQPSSSTRLRKGMKERSRQIAVHLIDEDQDGPRIQMADIKDPNLL